MRFPRLMAAALVVASAPFGTRAAHAQRADSARTTTLSLAQAITLALRNNPTHLQTLTARHAASAQRRAAFGALLPSANANLSALYQQQGQQPVSGTTLGASSDVYQSSYFLGLSYQIGAATFLNPRVQSANLAAANADVAGSAEQLSAQVAQDYLTVLQSAAKSALQDTLVVTNQAQLELAKAKLAVGSGTSLDVSRAQVAVGQQEVAAIQARNQVEVDKLHLFQDMGVAEPPNVQLTTSFPVDPPTLSLDSILTLARRQNPTLLALRSRDQLSGLDVKVAKSEYLPTLNLQTGWGGYTYQYANSNYPVSVARSQAQQNLAACYTTDSIRVGAGMPSIAAQCPQFGLTGADEAAIRAQNSRFPFNFTKQPFQLSASLSLPIFDGFAREARIEQAEANREDARYNVRARELQLTAAVTAAYLTLTTQAKTVALQTQNAAQARQEMALAEARYRVGAATFLDLADARGTYATAENDHINAIYEYHKAFAALESAVGRPLR